MVYHDTARLSSMMTLLFKTELMVGSTPSPLPKSMNKFHVDSSFQGGI